MSGFFTSMISSICGNIRSASKASSPSAKRRSTQCALVGLMHHRPNQLKTRNAPGTSFEPYPIPVLADPKKIIRALDGLRSLKSFPSADAVNTTTGPQLPKYVSHSFGSLDQPWEILSKVVYRGRAHPCWYRRQGARQSTRRNRPVHHPSEAGTISFAFPAAHHTSTASEFSLVLSTRSDSFKLRL